MSADEGQGRGFELRSGVQIRDDVALAPLTNTQSHADGTLGEEELVWLVRRAQGGFGWLSTCAAYVSNEGKAWEGQLGIASEAHLPGLTRLASALRAAGATPIVQLHHAGPHATLAPNGPLGTIDRPGHTRGATHAELAAVVQAFAAAAQRAEQAGFAGVEIHGANGYLFTHFLAPADNPREDEYGRDLAGRARLLREAVAAVRAAVSPGFAVGVRLSPIDLFAQRGLLLADSVQVARWAVEDGAEFIHLSLRDAACTAPEDPAGPAVARAFRDALPADVPVLAAGGIWTLEDLMRAHEAGVDVGVIGKASIGDPDWPRHMREPGFEPVRPPFTPELLRAGGAGEGFLRYAARHPGLIVGGTPPR